jgi:predicted nucleic acid-binding protein
MKRAYIDSCVWITRFEGSPEYKARIHQKLQELTLVGWEFCTSDLVLLEVLAKPLLAQQDDVAAKFRSFLETMRVLPLSSMVCQQALAIIQGEALKVVDALHVAIAIHARCQLFVSTDPHFRGLNTITPYWIDLSASVPA